MYKKEIVDPREPIEARRVREQANMFHWKLQNAVANKFSGKDEYPVEEMLLGTFDLPLLKEIPNGRTILMENVQYSLVIAAIDIIATREKMSIEEILGVQSAEQVASAVDEILDTLNMPAAQREHDPLINASSESPDTTPQSSPNPPQS